LGPLGDPTLPWFSIRGDSRHSRALLDFRVSRCTAEDCHGYNGFSPWLRASAGAPSPFLPFAGIFRPSPASCKKPSLQGAWASRPQSPLSVGGTPTLVCLEPRTPPSKFFQNSATPFQNSATFRFPPSALRASAREISLCVASLAPARLIRRFPNLLLLRSCLWQSMTCIAPDAAPCGLTFG
jgi:hypothetical protein